jgi:hypothetical protein
MVATYHSRYRSPMAIASFKVAPGSARGGKMLLLCGSALLLIGLSACSSSSPTTPITSATGSAGATAPTGSVGSSSIRPPSAGAGPSGSAAIPGAPTKLTGTIAEGVEANCLVLTDDSGAVVANLIGVDKASAPLGTKVVVSGKFEPDLMTTCQQGTPFAVAVIEQS